MIPNVASFFLVVNEDDGACGFSGASAPFAGGNPSVLTTSTTPALGAPQVYTLDAGGFPGSTTVFFAVSTGLANVPTPFGALLISLAPADLVVPIGVTLIVAGSATYTATPPADPSLCGLIVSTQAAIAGPPGFIQLTNAVDITLGDI